jgi:hypothetical protein
MKPMPDAKENRRLARIDTDEADLGRPVKTGTRCAKASATMKRKRTPPTASLESA